MTPQNTEAEPGQVSYLSEICARGRFDIKHDIANDRQKETGQEIDPIEVARAAQGIGIFEWDGGREPAVMNLAEHLRLEFAINQWNRVQAYRRS